MRDELAKFKTVVAQAPEHFPYEVGIPARAFFERYGDDVMSVLAQGGVACHPLLRYAAVEEKDVTQLIQPEREDPYFEITTWDAECCGDRQTFWAVPTILESLRLEEQGYLHSSLTKRVLLARLDELERGWGVLLGEGRHLDVVELPRGKFSIGVLDQRHGEPLARVSVETYTSLQRARFDVSQDAWTRLERPITVLSGVY